MLERGGPRTLGELCELRALTHADRPAVRDDRDALTYAELLARARAVAAVVADLGIRPGDRVLVQGRNSVGWVVAAVGVLLAGATVVPLGHRVAEDERRRLVEQLAPRLALLEDEAAPLSDASAQVVRFADLAALAPVRSLDPGHARVGAVDPSDAALVVCSSGTSGNVKAVPMTHGQLIRMYDDTRSVLDAVADDVWAGVVPLTHSFGFNGVFLVACLAGASVRLVPEYEPQAFAALVRRERVTVVAGPPAVYHDLAAGEGAADTLASVRLAIVGSTEVSATEMAGLARTLGLPRVVAGYGMTETCGTVAIGDLAADTDDPLPWMPPLPGVEVRIVDELGDELAVGGRGRVLVRGYHLCRPYADAPDLLPGGWFDTGDVGELDRAGRLAVSGRADDLINVSGFNVHPREVETVLREHPGVAEVAVIGVRDPRRGRRLVACVVPADRDSPPSGAELVAHARARLSPYKVPGEVRLMDRLPASITGKLSRAALRRSLESGTPARAR